MTKTLYECVEEGYAALKIAYEFFEKDEKYWKGKEHFEWISSVAMNGAISYQKQFTSYGTYKPPDGNYKPPQSQNTEGDTTPSEHKEMVTIKLSDGSKKTKDLRNEIKDTHLGFKWNNESYTWDSTMEQEIWEKVKDKSPFKDLAITIMEK